MPYIFLVVVGINLHLVGLMLQLRSTANCGASIITLSNNGKHAVVWKREQRVAGFIQASLKHTRLEYSNSRSVERSVQDRKTMNVWTEIQVNGHARVHACPCTERMRGYRMSRY